MFGSGYALGSQAALIFTSHFWREEMMDLSFVAPGFVSAAGQVRGVTTSNINNLAGNWSKESLFSSLFISSVVVFAYPLLLHQEVCDLAVHNFHQFHCCVQAG